MNKIHYMVCDKANSFDFCFLIQD